ncbi:MAG: adenylate/guanylate cyclase domain-containing protein [Hyphomicrobiales bacterium]|nr:adenylate/guanylate cyclase domain-containing protein [Hyphomicrobiales bacterium]
MVVKAGWAYIVLVALVLIGATAIRIADPFFLQALRLIAFDSYQRLAPQSYDPELPIRVVDIDEESLLKVGQWPWPRNVVADLFVRLTSAGAATVAFDVLFTEPDQTSPEQLAKRLAPEEAALIEPLIAARPSNDAILASAMGSGPSVLATVLTSDGRSAPVPVKAGYAVAGDDPRPFITAFAGGTNNLPELNAAASGIGAINWIPDRDQVVRRLPLVYRQGEEFVPTLVTEVLRVAQGAGSYILKASNASGETAFGESTGLNHIKVGGLEIPTNADGALLLQFRPSNPSAFIPAWSVLSGEFDPNAVANRIILVGSSAAGLNDLQATPLDASLPGVEVQAQAIEHLLSGRSLTRPDITLPLEILLVLVVGVLLAVVLPRISAGTSAALGLFVIVAVFLGAWLAYGYAGLLLDPTYPALAIFALVGSATVYTYRQVEQQRGEVRRAFGHYVSPAVVDELIANPDGLELGGEVRELTLLFCDVRNFTSISEKLTPHELTQFINDLLSPLSEVILEHRGTIDKYMGDAIMAFWNAPLDDPEHARNATRAALDMATRMEALNRDWRAEAEATGRPFDQVGIGIGINSGNCCVGNLGSTIRFDYSAIGDDVNLASRVEGLSKTYGLTIVLGESTVADCGEPVLELDLIRVKGRLQPSRLYTLQAALGGSQERLDQLVPEHEAMLVAYRAKDWDAAEKAITACRAAKVVAFDKYYDLFASRIATWRVDPPPGDWDGVFTATEK